MRRRTLRVFVGVFDVVSVSSYGGQPPTPHDGSVYCSKTLFRSLLVVSASFIAFRLYVYKKPEVEWPYRPPGGTLRGSHGPGMAVSSVSSRPVWA